MKDDFTRVTVEHLLVRVNDLSLGLKWLFGAGLFGVSIPNFLAALSIHHFADIFRDALPGKNFGALTTTLLVHPMFWMFLTILWPAMGILIVVSGRNVRRWSPAASMILFIIGGQLILTEAGLLSPMFDLMTDMGDPVPTC